MAADEYLRNLIGVKKAPRITLNDNRLERIVSILKWWADSQLSSLKQSGSNAKGTAIKGVADIDIFISLKSTTSYSLKEIFDSLDNCVRQNGIVTKRQNVSLGITQADLKIDLVPGKIQSGFQNWHSLYSSKKDSWMQTNVDLHINSVVNSGRQEEIILTKIWRGNHGLDFPSIYLEHIVIEALANKKKGDVANNFWAVLTYLQNSFLNKRVVDLANSNNIISDSLSVSEKQSIVRKAQESLAQTYWKQIVW